MLAWGWAAAPLLLIHEKQRNLTETENHPLPMPWIPLTSKAFKQSRTSATVLQCQHATKLHSVVDTGKTHHKALWWAWGSVEGRFVYFKALASTIFSQAWLQSRQATLFTYFCRQWPSSRYCWYFSSKVCFAAIPLIHLQQPSWDSATAHCLGHDWACCPACQHCQPSTLVLSESQDFHQSF